MYKIVFFRALQSGSISETMLGFILLEHREILNDRWVQFRNFFRFLRWTLGFYNGTDIFKTVGILWIHS